jgi:small multidrug resistance family-3 protein
MKILKPLLMFVLAALFELGGVYLIWSWLKEDKSIIWALVGFSLLMLYGTLNTIQVSGFGRTYAAYGGVFIILSLLWAWYFDKAMPDKYDLLGAVVVLVGACIIIYAPHKTGV